MSFKTHINEHFRSCHLLAEGKDPHRGRDVRLYMLPGEQRYVGVTDGVDAFVAPVDIQPFGVDCRKAIDALLQRIATRPPESKSQRVRIAPTGRQVNDTQAVLHDALDQQRTLTKERVRVQR